MKSRADPGVEALGIKVPSANVTRWGTALLLGIQLYFWLHLHEFNSKIDPALPVRDVAWIGVYESRAAICMMFVSACIVPAIALTLLIQRMPSDLPASWSHYARFAITLGTAILGTSLVFGTAERLWKLRKSLRSGAVRIRLN